MAVRMRSVFQAKVLVCLLLISGHGTTVTAQYYNNQPFNPIVTDNNNNNMNSNELPAGNFNQQPSLVNYPQQAQSFYNAYNPLYLAPSLQTSTYNICPEPFYFFDYDPLIMAVEDSSSVATKNAFNGGGGNQYEYDLNSKKNKTLSQHSKNKNATLALKLPRGGKFDERMMAMNSSDEIISSTRRPGAFGRRKSLSTGKPREFQSQILQNAQGNIIYINQLQMQGPVWQIIRQTYEKCCPLNRNRLRPTKLKDEIEVYQELLGSFSNQTNVLYLQSQGMFGLIELFNDAPHAETDAFSAHTVQILSSSGK